MSVHKVTIERPGAVGSRGYVAVCSCGWRSGYFGVNGGSRLVAAAANAHVSPTKPARKATARRGYRFGVKWIAENDEPECLDEYEVAGFVSVLLLADMFGKTNEEVAEAVVMERLRESHSD